MLFLYSYLLPQKSWLSIQNPDSNAPYFISAGALDLHEDPNEDDVFNREEVVTPKDITVHEDTFSSGGPGDKSHDQSHDPLILQDLSDQASSEAIPLSDLVSSALAVPAQAGHVTRQVM